MDLGVLRVLAMDKYLTLTKELDHAVSQKSDEICPDKISITFFKVAV